MWLTLTWHGTQRETVARPRPLYGRQRGRGLAGRRLDEGAIALMVAIGNGDGPSRVSILGMDAGGTMTDTIAVDERGRFTIGKALTTPHDESVGFFESVADALGYWDTTPEQVMPQLEAAIYAGTTMLNTLLRQRGTKLAPITTRGFEHYLLMGSGIPA